MSFNPALNVWTTLSRCVHEHADAPALVWDDRIVVCGGRSGVPENEDGSTSVIEEYESETDTWTVSQIKLPEKLDSHFVFASE